MSAQQPISLSIRQATPADAEDLIAFNQAMAYETEGLRLATETLHAGIHTALSDPAHGFYLVAERDGRVVGSLLVTFEWSDWRNGQFWWIQSVYVLPQYRGNGVYRTLYTAVRERARARDHVCGFRLYVERNNTRAQRTYAALGMAPTPYLMYEETIES